MITLLIVISIAALSVALVETGIYQKNTVEIVMGCMVMIALIWFVSVIYGN